MDLTPMALPYLRSNFEDPDSAGTATLPRQPRIPSSLALPCLPGNIRELRKRRQQEEVRDVDQYLSVTLPSIDPASLSPWPYRQLPMEARCIRLLSAYAYVPYCNSLFSSVY